MQLMKNNPFSIFNTKVSAELINSIGSRIGQAFSKEFHLDIYTTTNIFVNAMAYVYAGSSAEAYANAIASVSFQVLRNYNFLNSYNVFLLANTAANIISRNVSLGFGIDINMDGMYNVFDDNEYSSNVGSRINSNIGAEFGTATRIGAGLGFNARLGDGQRLNAGLGAEIGFNTGLGVGVNGAVGAGLNAGLGLGVNGNAKVGAGTRAGLRLGARLNSGPELGAEVNSAIGVGINSGSTLGAGFGAGLNAGVGIEADVNASLGIGADVNAGLELAAELNAGLGLEAGLNVGAEAGAGLGVGVKIGTSAGGANANNSLPEVIASFKQRLRSELLKDKVFKTVFSEPIPASAVSSLF
ncbi:spidroin 2B variant 1 [Trichonephila clavata]|uniref:Spidroin 2B variant 1 n=1 Tax=Trichonephila clavata TaxID=2740835 RepID=A0A8X6HN20_TRICU|nr:spidroin 2B variant 1 [Trichonephila clavata]